MKHSNQIKMNLLAVFAFLAIMVIGSSESFRLDLLEEENNNDDRIVGGTTARPHKFMMEHFVCLREKVKVRVQVILAVH